MRTQETSLPTGVAEETFDRPTKGRTELPHEVTWLGTDHFDEIFTSLLLLKSLRFVQEDRNKTLRAIFSFAAGPVQLIFSIPTKTWQLSLTREELCQSVFEKQYGVDIPTAYVQSEQKVLRIQGRTDARIAAQVRAVDNNHKASHTYVPAYEPKSRASLRRIAENSNVLEIAIDRHPSRKTYPSNNRI